jgi:hypothetical protein
MNTNLVGLAKIGAVVFSSALAALFVYDRATGGAFYRRMTEPPPAAAGFAPVSAPRTPLGGGQASDTPQQILLSGSKSGDMSFTVAGGTLEIQPDRPNPPSPAQSVYPPGINNAPHAAEPPTILMSGSKSLFVPPPSAAAPNTPPYAPSVPPAKSPPYANSPAYANVPLMPDDPGGPPKAAAPVNPSRPSTLMMGTKSAPVFSPPPTREQIGYPRANQPAQAAPRQAVAQPAAPQQAPRFKPRPNEKQVAR